VNPLWLITGAVFLVGAAIVIPLLRGAAEEARFLAEELARTKHVGDAVGRLRAELQRTRRPLGGRRYPSS
jgi:hypothetical protein